MLANKLMSAMAGGEEKLYSDDVFSTYLYTGNGSTQTINNGIDLAGQGGLVWIKDRFAGNSNFLYDTARGFSNALISDQAGGSFAASGFPTANTNGFSVTGAMVNGNNQLFASWTFRKAPKFFDVVTYTGDANNSRTISHSLGCQVGFVVIKATSGTGAWMVLHKGSLVQTLGMQLESTAAASATVSADDSRVNATWFKPYLVNTQANLTGVSYVAYLFAHDPSDDGIVQCGSFTTDASQKAAVTLGWEPQYILVKATNIAQDWLVIDTARNMSHGAFSDLRLNSSAAEVTTSGAYFVPNATGFTEQGRLNANTTYIYLAIRRPNKPPTTGTEVYNAIARTGTGAAATVTGVGFAPDLVMVKSRNAGQNPGWIDRLRGMLGYVYPASTSAEETGTSTFNTFTMDGGTIVAGTEGITNVSGNTYINHFFKRAPGFFDVVCYTGNGAARTMGHSLGVVPELIIWKTRSAAGGWWVYHASVGILYIAQLNTTNIFETSNAIYNYTSPTISTFPCGASVLNSNNVTYVAYLFATLPGISKVGGYTGNGTTQTINCGFTTGARFILIKRTNATGDWYVWDTARGIVSASDPHLSFNTAAAEVTTDDSVDPASSGFIVNQVAATNINVSGGQYIFLAIA